MVDDAEEFVEAKASPTKVFFISMLTRDIGLSDCILDLLDNSVDGIRNVVTAGGSKAFPDKGYAGFPVTIVFDEFHFRITDQSGGIALQTATEYAFRFGRPSDAPELLDGAIGVYGIGMKRAIFKVGRNVLLTSSTGKESFSLNLDVLNWSKQPEERMARPSAGPFL